MSENKFQTVQLPNELFFYRGKTVPHGVKGRRLDRVEYPDEGGIHTYFEGMKYPFRGFLDMGSIGRANIVKKYVKKDLRMASVSPLRYVVPLVFILPNFLFKRIFNTWISLLAQFCHEVMRVDWYDSNTYKLYSEPVGEIMRVFSKTVDLKDDETAWIVLSICTILEQDKAYRFRLQDAFSQLNKDAFTLNPRKELRRVIMILVERDSARDWRAMSKLILLGLWFASVFRRDLYKKVISFFDELNPWRLKLDTNDLYWCLAIDGYDFQGKPYEERVALQKTL